MFFNLNHFVVVDVEGNGQTPQEIVELSIVPITKGIIESPKSWLIKPKRKVTERAYKIHGISNQDLANSFSREDITSEVRAALGTSVVVGHNVAIDTGLIRNHFGDWSPEAILDTIKLAKYVNSELDSYSLDSLIKEYKLDSSPYSRHRASGDAQLTAQLFITLISYLKDSQHNLLTLSQISGSRDDPFIENKQGTLF